MADLRAHELLAGGLCSALCLLAGSRDNRACDCCCKGRWHGALGAAVVPDTAALRKPPPPPQPGPALIDRAGAVVDLDRAHAEMDARELDRLAAREMEMSHAPARA